MNKCFFEGCKQFGGRDFGALGLLELALAAVRNVFKVKLSVPCYR